MLANMARLPGFFLEFMWHVVFGQDDELPSRADDVTLPVSLCLSLGDGARRWLGG
jgi:hypothetical protein